MLNDKELNILNNLYQSTRPISLDDLALQHKLSQRSIRTYVTRINSAFQAPCISLKKGMLEISDPNSVTNYLKNYQVTNYSAQALVSYMLHKLLLENKINLSHFVIQFEVSRTTAKNYLNQVKEQLEQSQLKLDHSTGITLLGKEADKRHLILNLFLHLDQQDHIESQLLEPLFAPLLEENNQLTAFLQKMLNTLHYTLSEHSHTVLLRYLQIVCYRNRQGFPLTEIANKAFLENSGEYQSTKTLFQELESQLGFSLTLPECLEIINKIMGLHYSIDKESELHNWFEYDLFISKLIRRFSKKCGYNLVGDFQLYDNLLNHIKPAMYRIAHHIQLHPFDFHFIQKSSQEEYAITQELLISLHFFPSTEEAQNHQDEVALICVYFKQAVEKQKSAGSKNVLLLSNYGYGSSLITVEKIQAHYQVDELECIPSHELKNVDQTKFHLVITTDSSIEVDESLPVVEISPFFQKEDRHRLSQVLSPKEIASIPVEQLLELIGDYATIHDESALEQALCRRFPSIKEKESSVSLLDFISEDCIRLDVEANSIREVLCLAGDLLKANGNIEETYTQNLIESFENYGIYMMIDPDVAIPHTKNTGNVRKTGFTFIRLKNPIHFDKHELSMFFTFCTRNNKEHLEALILISDIIKNVETKKSMLNLRKPKEILTFLAESKIFFENS